MSSPFVAARRGDARNRPVRALERDRRDVSSTLRDDGARSTRRGRVECSVKFPTRAMGIIPLVALVVLVVAFRTVAVVARVVIVVGTAEALARGLEETARASVRRAPIVDAEANTTRRDVRGDRASSRARLRLRRAVDDVDDARDRTVARLVRLARARGRRHRVVERAHAGPSG
tara:strand:- start:17888 stop:18409 length:522 start_codon:yes stop_codon:yes gene_type:complete